MYKSASVEPPHRKVQGFKKRVRLLLDMFTTLSTFLTRDFHSQHIIASTENNQLPQK